VTQYVSDALSRRHRLEVYGTVQGVGFRPFVYRLANELGLGGWVENTPRGVTIEVEGPRERLAAFQVRLETDKPPLATIESHDTRVVHPEGQRAFCIRGSTQAGSKIAVVPPDVATCPDCLRDILDPKNRRYRYPFTNCTNCGPRFSIIEALPYDRANTSMKRFAMCDACRREYDDPRDRRFHAQPNACPRCGPNLELWDVAGRVVHRGNDALSAATRCIRAGLVVAVKGLGGFQLIVDARNEDAVARLRRRKHREERPFALMVADMEGLERLCHVDDEERRLVQSPQAPIVLLRRRHDGEAVAESVAPGNPYLGLMLPYTPLHHLLMRELAFPIVATSGNLSDEPICIDEREALDRLHGLADAFVVHDRPIVRHVDDSVARVIRGRAMVIRRARGYAPLPVAVPDVDEPILAVGAHQKNAVAFAHGGHVFISQHIGDLATPQSIGAFERAVADIPALYDATPTTVACDLHPDYHSTVRAHELTDRPVLVQHHHAHVVSCMADNDLDGRVLGVSWDGTGLGTDGTIWGGEFLLCDRSRFERFAHLRTFRLPGGDAAAREPRRSALGLLYELLGDSVFDRRDLGPIRAFNESERRVLWSALRGELNCPVTSSMGRLFDAVASLIGVRQRVHHEGQAAVELEFVAETEPVSDAYPFRLAHPEDGTATNNDVTPTPWIIDWVPMIAAILDDVRRSEAPGRIARRFHNTLVEVIAAVAGRAGESRVVLSGGCFQNRLLLETTIARLEHEGFHAYWHQRVPTNDGGIALGQAVVARARLAEARTCV